MKNSRLIIISSLIISISLCIIAYYTFDSLIPSNIEFGNFKASGVSKVGIIALMIILNMIVIRRVVKSDEIQSKLDNNLKKTELELDIIIQVIVHEKKNETKFIDNPEIILILPNDTKKTTSNPSNFSIPRRYIGAEIKISASKVGYDEIIPITLSLNDNNKPLYIGLKKKSK